MLLKANCGICLRLSRWLICVSLLVVSGKPYAVKHLTGNLQVMAFASRAYHKYENGDSALSAESI